MAMIRNRPSDEGRQLGAKLAEWCDAAEPNARLKVPDLPPRCASCAFRAGTHTANGSPTTQMDALKCVMEGIEFQCHEPGRKGHSCSGWLMMALDCEDGWKPQAAPWPFSDEMDPAATTD